jgi:hypothetical protein
MIFTVTWDLYFYPHQNNPMLMGTGTKIHRKKEFGTRKEMLEFLSRFPKDEFECHPKEFENAGTCFVDNIKPRPEK